MKFKYYPVIFLPTLTEIEGLKDYHPDIATRVSDIANARLVGSQIPAALKEAKKIMVSARGDYSVRFQSTKWLKEYGGLVE